MTNNQHIHRTVAKKRRTYSAEFKLQYRSMPVKHPDVSIASVALQHGIEYKSCHR